MMSWRQLSLPVVGVIAAISCLSVTLIGMSTPLYAQTQGQAKLRTLTATGIAEVRARPDMAEVRLGVVTEAVNVTDAASGNAVRVSKIVSVLKSLDVPERDIQTSSYQIFPVRRFEPGVAQVGEPPIVAYQVSNMISVRTVKFDLVPRIIDQSVKAGANRVDDVSFVLKDQTASNQQALGLAVADARRNAETMAKELGIKLVAVQTVLQGVAYTPPVPMFAKTAALESTATPIFPGEVTLNATATLTYVIE